MAMETPKSWGMDMGRFILAFCPQAAGLEDGDAATFSLLLYL